MAHLKKGSLYPYHHPQPEDVMAISNPLDTKSRAMIESSFCSVALQLKSGIVRLVLRFLGHTRTHNYTAGLL